MSDSGSADSGTRDPLHLRSPNAQFQTFFATAINGGGTRNHARLRVELPQYKFKKKILLLRLGLKENGAHEMSVGTILVQPVKAVLDPAKPLHVS